MRHDYFYYDGAEKYAFLFVPMVLITEQEYRGTSADAKLLYALMLNRTSLSRRNGWLDELGRVYIYYTIENVMEDLCCANAKATKLMKELEKLDLIERRRQGLGKPTMIYVKDFSDHEDEEPAEVLAQEITEYQESGNEICKSPESHSVNLQNHDNNESRCLKSECPESRNANTNKTDNNHFNSSHPEINETEKNYPKENHSDPILSEGIEFRKNNNAIMRQAYKEHFARQLAYDALIHDNPTEKNGLTRF